MSLQYIIDRAQQIEIDRRKMVGQTISRSQRIKTSERASAQPWKWKVTPPGAMKWQDARGVVELIDFNDRITEYTISLSNVRGMDYITEYKGSLTSGQLDALTISSAGTNTFVITTLPSVNSATVMFRPGDVIQPTDSRYPYTVVSTVTRGLSTTTSVQLHRNVITSEDLSLSGQTLRVGTECTWRVVISGLPTYTFTPNKLVQYTGDFELFEKII